LLSLTEAFRPPPDALVTPMERVLALVANALVTPMERVLALVAIALAAAAFVDVVVSGL
jgi:hypothetical protein